MGQEEEGAAQTAHGADPLWGGRCVEKRIPACRVGRFGGSRCLTNALLPRTWTTVPTEARSIRLLR